MSYSQRQKCLVAFFELALDMHKDEDADAIMVVLDEKAEWEKLTDGPDRLRVIVASDRPEHLEGAEEAGLIAVVLDLVDAPVFEKLTQALLQSVADEKLVPSAEVIALYSGFEPGQVRLD